MFDFVAFKKYIEENGIKQKFVAQQAQIADATLSAIATGRVKCSLESYVAICKALSVPFGMFLDTDIQPAV